MNFILIQSSSGKQNWKDTFYDFVDQLSVYSLKIRDVSPDGNCLFRSIADQLEGDQHNHKYYRDKICNYLELNKDDFSPFIDGDFLKV